MKEHVRRQGWAEPYKSAIEWVPEHTPVLKDQLKIWKTIPWGSRGGRVTLAGDAAHAMTFRMYRRSAFPPFALDSDELPVLTRFQIAGRARTTRSLLAIALLKLLNPLPKGSSHSRRHWMSTKRKRWSVEQARCRCRKRKHSLRMTGTIISIALWLSWERSPVIMRRLKDMTKRTKSK